MTELKVSQMPGKLSALEAYSQLTSVLLLTEQHSAGWREHVLLLLICHLTSGQCWQLWRSGCERLWTIFCVDMFPIFLNL